MTDHLTDDLAAAVSDVAQRKLIEAELERRNAFLQLLQVVSVAANGAPTSLTQALQTTLDEVCSQTGWTVGHVLLPTEQANGTLVSTGIWRVRDRDAAAELLHRHEHVLFPPGVGVAGRVFISGRPEHIADLRTLASDDPDRARCSLINGGTMRAMAGFPVIVGGEVGGVLEFFSDSPFEADQMLLDVMAQVGLLLGRIVERTQYEAALRKARQVAEVASAAKTQFLSRMSHELRTPLTAVLGYAQLLDLSDLADQDREYVAAIEKGGNHLLALINDVLDVTRTREGRAAAVRRARGRRRRHPRRQRPDAAARGGARSDPSLRPSHGARHLALGDNQAIRQVMLNLLANGIKYNRPGGEVATSIVDRGDGTVQIDVSDTGYGIAAPDLSTIFIPFERLGMDRAVEGTGLGLGISRQLIDAMGGTLEARSIVGSGTTLSIVLAASQRAPESRAALSVPLVAKASPGAARKVLYVEDNIVNIELMQTFFTRLRPGLKLVSTMMGELAVDLAREHAPHLILLDVNLPDIDGGEVIRRLHADDRTRAIPVVMVSADAIPSGIERFLSAGAIGYVTKPIEVARLLEFVDQATGGAEPRDAAELVGRPPEPAEAGA